MKSTIILSFLLIFFSCSPAYVASDYDRDVDFNQYKTYNYFSDIDWKDLNQLDQNRMINAIDTELAKDGMHRDENPDIWVDVMVDEKIVKRNTGNVGVGSGSWGRGMGVGVSIGIPISSKKLNKNYIIEMVDAKNENLIWQGIYEKDASLKSDNQTIIPEAMQKVFEKFPPKID